MCVHADADGRAHTTEAKVFDDFSCDVCRSPSLFVVWAPSVFCENGPVMWWSKTQFCERKKKSTLVGLTVASLPSRPALLLSPCIGVKLIY